MQYKNLSQENALPCNISSHEVKKRKWGIYDRCFLQCSILEYEGTHPLQNKSAS